MMLSRLISRLNPTFQNITTRSFAKAKVEGSYSKINRISLWPPEIVTEQKVAMGLSYEFDKNNVSTQQPNQSNNGYDLVIQCDSLRDLNDNGWPLVFQKNHHLWCDDHIFNVHKTTPLITVAISGVYNSGKTFILNNLCSLDLPSNFKVHTEGISFKHLHPGSNILLMDTAGQNSPIQVADRKSISDKISSERVLQNTLYELATFHVCVVQELKWNDQYHFELLYDQIMASREDPNATQQTPLIVVHNLMKYDLYDLKNFLFDRPGSDDYNIQSLYRSGVFQTNDTKIKDITAAFEQLIDDFAVEAPSWRNSMNEMKENVKKKPKFWFDSKGHNQTYHVFLVDNSSSSGEIYNYYVLRQIEDLITTQSARPFEFSLDKVFKVLDGEVTTQSMFVNSKKEAVNPKSSLKANVQEESQNISANLGVARFDTEKEHIKDYRMMLHPALQNENITVDLKDPRDLTWNTLYLSANGWYPKYDVQYSNDGKTCKVFAEIPGNIKGKYSYDIKDNQLVISGTRDRDSDYFEGAGSDDRLVRHFDRIDTTIGLKEQFDKVVEQDRFDGVVYFKIEKRKRIGPTAGK
eukprot:395331_1